MEKLKKIVETIFKRWRFLSLLFFSRKVSTLIDASIRLNRSWISIFSPLNFMFKYFTFPLYLISILRAASVTRFFKISPLWQKFTSLWQIFDGNDLAKCWAYFDKFMTLLGKLSLSQIAKYWKIFQPSGHTDSSKQLFEKDVIGLLIGFEFLCR